MSQVEPVEMRRSGGGVSRGEVKSRYVSLVECVALVVRYVILVVSQVVLVEVRRAGGDVGRGVVETG